MKTYIEVSSVIIRAVLGFALVAVAPSALALGTAGFFSTDGPDIVDPDGNPVVLKGVGLGGWLMPEGYILHIAAPDGGSPRTILAQIEDLIGPQNTDQFYEIYRANYVEEKDVAAIAGWGFDHIRLPFHYNVFYDPDTGTFKEDGFALLDTFLEWCRTHGLYVILDMHATPGAQNALNISDSDGVARLWTEPDPYQDQTVEIWTEIARRYADETQIIGYDLINEPVTPDGVTTEDLFVFYERLAEAVRQVDTNHILFIEGNYFATTFLAPEDLVPFDDNMVYTFHKYWNGTALNSIQYLLDIRDETNVPLWLGETGENSNTWFYLVTLLMKNHGIGVNWWTHKKIETTTSPLSAPFAPGYEAVLDYWRGSGPRPSAQAARAGVGIDEEHPGGQRRGRIDGNDVERCRSPGGAGGRVRPREPGNEQQKCSDHARAAGRHRGEQVPWSARASGRVPASIHPWHLVQPFHRVVKRPAARMQRASCLRADLPLRQILVPRRAQGAP